MTWRWAMVWGVLATSAWPALRGEDPVAADAIWGAAQQEADGARIWVDAARVNNNVAPWQSEWPQARRRVARVAAQRRALLVNDRGGVRRPVEVHP